MATYIPAIRATMGDLEYFVAVVTLGEASRMIEYVEEVDGWTSETPPELKSQRKLNVQRVEREMLPYLISNPDHFYSALTVEMRSAPSDSGDGCPAFSTKESFPGGMDFGLLTLDGTEALYALDGQHRLKSIELAIRQKPELARDHIALILVPFHNVTRSQSLFSDLNRYAKGPSKSISILFTHREGLARVTKALAGSVPLLRDRVNLETTSLSVNARHFITLSTLYEMTRTLVGERPTESAADEEKVTEELKNIWELLTAVVPQWRVVATGDEHPAYLRQRYLSMHGVAQQAIALVAAKAGREARQADPECLAKLSEIDWSLMNPAWQNVAIQGGRVNNTSTSVRLLANAISSKLGLTVDGPAEIPVRAARGPKTVRSENQRMTASEGMDE